MCRRSLSLVLLAATLTAPLTAQDQKPTPGENNLPPKGFTALFDGKTIDGWWGMSTEDPRKLFTMGEEKRLKKMEASQANIKTHWRAEGGELINDGHGLFLTTKKNYGDFELWVDYKTVAKADSGIYLRGVPQIQIWDYTKAGGKWKIGADKGSGGLWNNSKNAQGKNPSVLADKPFGEWNRFHIVMIGDTVSVTLNDKLVVDKARLENYFARKEPVPMHGPIQLQTHGGEIRWRNVFLREIGSQEANDFLRAQNSDGLESVFNGKDFSGWQGPTDNYEILDGGVLRCKSHKGGTLFTAAQYGDFVAEFDVKFPPGGNNGLAIRYPGKGDTAYMGMCELQVLENTHKKYGTLDARQYHGSAYGMAAAKRGFQRPVGSWNHQRVTVKGSTIKVELNGFEILNTDLSKITEFMANKPHPGMGRTFGHFGFAGHNDPVEFRKVRIKDLGGAKPPMENAKKTTAAAANASTSSDWAPLFDGKTLKGWKQKNGTASYVVENGAILGTTAKGSPNSFLCTTKDYADFELEFEVKVHNSLNSGVQIRSVSRADYKKGRVHGPQVEIEAGPGESGHIYSEGTGRGWISTEADRNDKAKRVAFKNDTWNQYRVVAEGKRIQTWVNGVAVGDVTLNTSQPAGFIGLQVHGIGKQQGPFQVRWRKLRIREH